jgi:hypothetical protein
VIGEPDLEAARHGECADLGGEGAVLAGAQQQQADVVVLPGLELGRERAAECDAKAARHEVRHAALDHGPREGTALGLVARVDSTHDGPGEGGATRKEALHLDERLDAYDPRLVPCARREVAQRRGVGGRRQRRVGGQRQEPHAQLALEAVHNRQDRDERRDTEADPGEGYPADEGHEILVLPGADVAQPEPQGQWRQHVR